MILICVGNTCFSLLVIPIVLEHLLSLLSVFCFQFRCASSVRPSKLMSDTNCIGISSIFKLGKSNLLFIIFLNIMYLDLLAFRDNRFTFSHSAILPNSLLIVSLKLFSSDVLLMNDLLWLNTVVSSAYIINLN